MTEGERKIRVLVAKPGLDGHDRGAKVIASAFRDAGFEVIYTGLHQTPEMIASAALQEDVDAVGLSVLSGAHNFVFPEIRRLLDEQGMKEVVLFGGGIIPEGDVPGLLERLSRSRGDLRPIRVGRQVHPNYTLEQHWHRKEAVEAVRSGAWDFVVLQEQSQRPIYEPQLMHEYARRFNREIRNRGAKTLLYLTWADEDRPEDLSVR